MNITAILSSTEPHHVGVAVRTYIRFNDLQDLAAEPAALDLLRELGLLDRSALLASVRRRFPNVIPGDIRPDYLGELIFDLAQDL